MNQETRHHTLSPDQTPSEGVYSVVAALEGCSPVDLTPLAAITDPDAFDTLLGSESGTDRISITYCGYEVEVNSDELRVRDIETQ